MYTYKGKKVLILGLGLNEGGVGAAKFFAKAGAEVRVTDLKKEEVLKDSLEKLKEFSDISYTLGGHREEDIDWADLVIKNTAIRPGNKYVEYALKQGKEVETDTGVFLNLVSPKQIIGVTGTKGKTTTSSLIYYALKLDPRFRGDDKREGGDDKREGGDDKKGRGDDKRVVLAGNIGKSVLDALDNINEETLVILEISSFQLQAFEEKKISPFFAVITNIFPDHLNYHKDMDEYIQAKRVIAKYQEEDNYLFLGAAGQVINSPDFLKDLKAKIIKYSKNDLPRDFKPTLAGEHNLDAYAASLGIAKMMGVPDEQALQNMNKFAGADFRLQKIYEKDGITIINDSASTNPEAGIAALKTYPNSVLIAGGMNKGLDYKEFIDAINRFAKQVYFLAGDVTEEIKGQVESDKYKGTFNNLEDLISAFKNNLEGGDVVLFSPGATSFNLFQNEFDRGDKFNKAVKNVFKD